MKEYIKYAMQVFNVSAVALTYCVSIGVNYFYEKQTGKTLCSLGPEDLANSRCLSLYLFLTLRKKKNHKHKESF